ncbi:uncharacterized protein BJX67DRAFT_350861 [Aspergillus lucknowensis]|uniref:Secreted protein n=1 Tax=Aspergillus lucknowensis TaxID=176173 RepID=A0ABR4LV74_9EURO
MLCQLFASFPSKPVSSLHFVCYAFVLLYIFTSTSVLSSCTSGCLQRTCSPQPCQPERAFGSQRNWDGRSSLTKMNVRFGGMCFLAGIVDFPWWICAGIPEEDS